MREEAALRHAEPLRERPERHRPDARLAGQRGRLVENADAGALTLGGIRTEDFPAVLSLEDLALFERFYDHAQLIARPFVLFNRMAVMKKGGLSRLSACCPS
jgi:hypothetical protein